MERKKQGTFIYDEEKERYDIRFSLEHYYGGCIVEKASMSSSTVGGCPSALR